MLFTPDYRLKSVLKIDTDFLEKQNLKGLILDLDNTLTLHGIDRAENGVQEWLDLMKKSGIKLMLVSNNTYERVLPTANRLGLDFVSNGKKPLPSGFKKAVFNMGLSKNETAVVGDQIFTDVLGGKLSGIRTILVEPFEIEREGFLAFKRKIQIKLLGELK